MSLSDILAQQALKLAKQPVSQAHLDPSLSGFINALNATFTPGAVAFSTGQWQTDRAISSNIICGWASAMSYQGEVFNGADVYVIPAVPTATIRCSIMDTNMTVITSGTNTANGNGWLSFQFPLAVDSTKISGNTFYLGVEVVGHGSALQIPSVTGITNRYVSSATYPDKYAVTSDLDPEPSNKWANAYTPSGTYVVLANIKSNYITTQSISGMKTPVITATNTSAGNRTNPFNGMGIQCNNDSNVSNFNMLKIPFIGRSGVNLNTSWRRIVAEVRDVDYNGTLIATGTTLVDHDTVPLKNVEVILTDPTTGNPKTVTKSMLSSTYFIGYYALNISGGYAWAGEGFGTTPNYSGKSYYRGNGIWTSYSGNPSMGIESWLVTSPVINNQQVYKMTSAVASTPVIASSTGSSLITNLPPKIYALVGKETNIYLDNLINFNASDYLFDVSCSVGVQQNERWTLTPVTNPTGAPSNLTTATTGGNLAGGQTYYVKYTWANLQGETQTSSEVSIAVPSGTNTNTISFNIPTLPTNVTSANIYISTSTGTETKQGSTTGTSYTQSATLVTGTTPPASNTIGDVGTYSLTVNVYDKKTLSIVNTATTSVVVTKSNSGSGITKKALFIGDSTTAAGAYTQQLLNLVGSDSYKVNLLGTQGISPNVHEGRGGWTVALYYTDNTSPFVFSGTFNFAQYMTNHSYSGLNYVGIHLGINDMFSYTDDTSVTAQAGLVLNNYDAMISSIHAYDSTIKVGVMVTIPPSMTQDAFGANYSSGQTRWRYKQNIMLWLQQLISKFANRESSNIYLVPINVNLDTANNMQTISVAQNAENYTAITRQNNGVHPAVAGYNQMGDMIYYWLKSYES